MVMLPAGAALIPPQQIRRLRRVEYERLVAEGFFHEERVELVFGTVVEMTPIDPAHCESVSRIERMLMRQLADRAQVRSENPFAATDDSEPEPDVIVVPDASYWDAHPDRAFLIVEVARTSLHYDRDVKSLLYGFSIVDEYWIVNHVDGIVEVRRDRRDGVWNTVTVHRRGEVISMLAFPDVQIPVAEILPPLEG
jgi:Uma2 family endonuclease